MSIEVQDVFAASFDSYAALHTLTRVHWKAARAIILCRTAVLGAQVETTTPAGIGIVPNVRPSPRRNGWINSGRIC